MFQIDVSTAASTQPASTALGTVGYFTDGNAATGVPATVVPAEFLNAIMLEMMNTITGAGIALSKSSFNQLLTAIKSIGQGGASNYAADYGSANAYAATYSPTVSAPTDGTVRAFKVKVTNTGASTFILDGSGVAYPIYGLNGTALQGGELTANGIAVMRFNSSLNSGVGAWVLYHCGMSPMQIAPATKSNHATQSQQVQNATHVYAPDSGAANAYVGSYTPAVTGLTDGMCLTFKASHTNTGASTFTPNSGVVVASPIYGGDHSPLTGGEIAVNGDCEVMWNAALNGGNGAWVLLASTAGYMKGPTPPQNDNSSKYATTAFVKAAGLQFSTVANVSASRNLVAADVGAKLLFQGSFTLTIQTPQSIGAQPGDVVLVSSYGASTGTVAFSGTTYAYGTAGQSASLTVKSGESLMLVVESATTWQIGPSTAGLGQIGSFAASGLANGYAKLPSGIIFQWGVSTFSTSGSGVTYPIAFPTGVFGIFTGNNISNGVFSSCLGLSLTGFNGYINTGANGNCYWFAIGN